MSNTLKLKRGTAAQVAGYTGPYGELIFNATTKTIHAQDGQTPGGVAILSSATIETPTLVSPGAQGTHSVPPLVTFTEMSSGMVHAYSQWQIAGNTSFNAPIYDSGVQDEWLNFIDINELGLTFISGNTYYIRPRYFNASGEKSKWATQMAFKIA